MNPVAQLIQSHNNDLVRLVKERRAGGNNGPSTHTTTTLRWLKSRLRDLHFIAIINQNTKEE